MKISRVNIKNYKSIKEIDFFPNDKFNIFIGENSVGKSNIFDAINWLIGPTYPSMNSLKKEDKYLGDISNKIEIKLEFDDGQVLELGEEWTDYKGNIKKGLKNYISDEVRQKYTSA